MNTTVGSVRQLLRAQAPLLTLIGAMFLIFFGQILSDGGWYATWMAVPGEIVRGWRQIAAGEGSAGDWRELGTLLSCAFLHGNFEHVLFNMLFLWIFAALVSELIGWGWMLVIFVLTAVAGSVTHTAMHPEDLIPMLGASGAVMGFEGAYLGLAVRWKLPDPHIWPMARPIPPAQLALLAVIGVAIDYYSIMSGADGRIAYGAHVGGFTMGVLITALVAPRPALARG